MYKIRSNKHITFNKYATNLKTTISHRSLRNSSLLLLLIEFNNFSFLIDIIDNIIMRPEHVTRTPTNGSAVLLSHVTSWITWPVHCTAIGGSSGHVVRIYLTYIQFSIILAQFYVNFSRQEHKIDVLSFNNSWDSQVSAYNPFNFSFKHNLTH